jgi:hypothetical protein
MTVLTGCRRAQANVLAAVALAVACDGATLPAVAAVIGDRPIGTHGSGAARPAWGLALSLRCRTSTSTRDTSGHA